MSSVFHALALQKTGKAESEVNDVTACQQLPWFLPFGKLTSLHRSFSAFLRHFPAETAFTWASVSFAFANKYVCNLPAHLCHHEFCKWRLSAVVSQLEVPHLWNKRFFNIWRSLHDFATVTLTVATSFLRKSYPRFSLFKGAFLFQIFSTIVLFYDLNDMPYQFYASKVNSCPWNVSLSSFTIYKFALKLSKHVLKGSGLYFWSLNLHELPPLALEQRNSRTFYNEYPSRQAAFFCFI